MNINLEKGVSTNSASVDSGNSGISGVIADNSIEEIKLAPAVKTKLNLANSKENIGVAATLISAASLAIKGNSTKTIADLDSQKVSTTDLRLSDARTPLAHNNHVSTDITDFNEAVQDSVAALFANGTHVNITPVYNDNGNLLSFTVASTGDGSGGLDSEQVNDTIAAAISGLGLIAVTKDDTANSVTITTTATQNITDVASAALMDSKDTAIKTDLLGGVVEAGNNLSKLYALITGLNTASHTHTNKATLDTITDELITTWNNKQASGDYATTTDLANKVDKVTGKGLSTEDYTTTEKTKLSGIATGATANSTDAQLRDRSTHTGTQSASTIVQDASNRFATDTEKATWNAKQAAIVANNTLGSASMLVMVMEGGVIKTTTLENFGALAYPLGSPTEVTAS